MPVAKGKGKVYIVGGGYEYIKLMYSLGFDGAKGVFDADVVLFTGGEDVTPDFYGEVPMARTNYNRVRDDREKSIFQAALLREVPMVGICRGGQFLNVMNGGKMWQHVSDHCRPHDLIIEVPPFIENNQKRRIEATSTHHQMMIPTDEAFIIATALECREKCAPGYTKMGIKPSDPDIEVLWYQDTNCLCFQPHPEHANASADLIDFFEECLDNYVLPMKPVKRESIIKSVPKTKKEEEPKRKTLLGIVPKGESKKV